MREAGRGGEEGEPKQKKPRNKCLNQPVAAREKGGRRQEGTVTKRRECKDRSGPA